MGRWRNCSGSGRRIIYHIAHGHGAKHTTTPSRTGATWCDSFPPAPPVLSPIAVIRLISSRLPALPHMPSSRVSPSLDLPTIVNYIHPYIRLCAAEHAHRAPRTSLFPLHNISHNTPRLYPDVRSGLLADVPLSGIPTLLHCMTAVAQQHPPAMLTLLADQACRCYTHLTCIWLRPSDVMFLSSSETLPYRQESLAPCILVLGGLPSSCQDVSVTHTLTASAIVGLSFSWLAPIARVRIPVSRFRDSYQPSTKLISSRLHCNLMSSPINQIRSELKHEFTTNRFPRTDELYSSRTIDFLSHRKTESIRPR